MNIDKINNKYMENTNKFITIKGGKNISKRLYVVGETSQNLVDFLDIRYWYYDGIENTWKPTREGIHLLGNNIKEFINIIKEYENNQGFGKKISSSKKR